MYRSSLEPGAEAGDIIMLSMDRFLIVHYHELGLKKGMAASAVIKSSDVMVAVD